MSQDFCGIVFIGGGSSWAYSGSIEEAAKLAAKIAKKDWKSIFKFKRKQEFTVNVYDCTNTNGWYADYRGVFKSGTQDPLPFVEQVKVTV